MVVPAEIVVDAVEIAVVAVVEITVEVVVVVETAPTIIQTNLLKLSQLPKQTIHLN